MFINLVSFSSAELNTAVNVAKTITDKTLVDSEGITETYRPTKIIVTNNTNATFSYGLFTAKEYTAYSAVSGSSYSDLIPIVNAGEDEIINIEGEISTIVACGTSGHSGSAGFVVYQEH